MKSSYASDVKTSLSIQEWSRIIKDRNSTKLTIDEYCEQHGLSRNSYYYWLRKIRDKLLEEQQGELSATNELVEIRPNIIVPVNDTTPNDNQCIGITINGITLAITPDITPEFLLRTLEVIRRA